MSMDKLEAIPVDTHVLSIAVKHYKYPHKRNVNSKSNGLSDKIYRDIGDMFRRKWGDCAGWAQTVMFIDDLKGEFLKHKTEEEPMKLEPKLEPTVKSEPSDYLIKTEPFIKVEPKTETLDKIDSKENLATNVKLEPELIDRKIKRTNENMIASPAPSKSKLNRKKRKC